MSPAISFLVSRFFSNIDFGVSRKLDDLKINTIPKLKQTLRDADQQKMMGQAEEKKMPESSDLVILEKKNYGSSQVCLV